MQGLEPEEVKSLLLSVGSHRKERRLSPLEVGVLLKRAVDAGASRQQLAAELQIGPTQVTEFLPVAMPAAMKWLAAAQKSELPRAGCHGYVTPVAGAR